MAPTHLLRLETVDLVPRDDRRTGIAIRGRQPSVSAERVRGKRRGLCARGHRGSARGKSKGEFQKVAAFHDVSLFAYASDAKRVSSRQDECSLNWAFTIVVSAKAEPTAPLSSPRTRGPITTGVGFAEGIS
jgi:hypothetical protein